jgi:hypothetical protein
MLLPWRSTVCGDGDDGYTIAVTSVTLILHCSCSLITLMMVQGADLFLDNFDYNAGACGCSQQFLSQRLP